MQPRLKNLMKLRDVPAATGEVGEASADRNAERNAELPRKGIADANDSELVIQDKEWLMSNGEQAVEKRYSFRSLALIYTHAGSYFGMDMHCVRARSCHHDRGGLLCFEERFAWSSSWSWCGGGFFLFGY